MNEKVENISLQPLRIPDGWWIIINQFYEIEPDWKDKSTDEIKFIESFFDEDMYYAEYRTKMLAIDLSWSWLPGKKYEGKFHLQLLKLLDEEKMKFHKKNKAYTMEADFEDPIDSFTTENKDILIKKIEEYFQYPSK